MRTAIVAAAALAMGWPAHGAAQVKVGIRPGMHLTWVTALDGEPDYEAVLSVQNGDSSALQLQWAWNRGESGEWKTYERTLSSGERRRARSYYFFAKQNDPRQFRGTTPAMLSSKVLEELRTAGRAEVVVLHPAVATRPFRGELKRIGTAAHKVLLDGIEVSLAGVQLHGRFSGEREVESDLLVLDDADAPWILRARSRASGKDVRGGGYELTTIETGAVKDGLAAALARDCSATLHNIRFATGSDALDSVSINVVRAVAGVLAANPSWKLTIIGHTDSIGTATANLDLSQRRARRVVTVLTGSFHVAPARLAADGRGETQLVGDNGTVPGRASSRRVELVRECATKPVRRRTA